jgi:hypothetical protein
MYRDSYHSFVARLSIALLEQALAFGVCYKDMFTPY